MCAGTAGGRGGPPATASRGEATARTQASYAQCTHLFMINTCSIYHSKGMQSFSLCTCKSVSIFSTLCPFSTKRNEEAYNIGRLRNSHINIKTEEASSNAAHTQLYLHPFPNLQLLSDDTRLNIIRGFFANDDPSPWSLYLAHTLSLPKPRAPLSSGWLLPIRKSTPPTRNSF